MLSLKQSFVEMLPILNDENPVI